MPEEPTHREPPEDDSGAREPRSSRLIRFLILLGILAVVVAAIVVVAVAVDRDDDSVSGTSGTGGDGATMVTSPYDLHELPADADPDDVKNAALVSISLPNESGGTDYFGLSSDIDPAKALIEAVSKADETEASDLTPSGATLTFLFDDRSTLGFDLYLEEGVIARGETVWQVDGDLAALVGDAVSAGRL